MGNPFDRFDPGAGMRVAPEVQAGRDQDRMRILEQEAQTFPDDAALKTELADARGKAPKASANPFDKFDAPKAGTPVAPKAAPAAPAPGPGEIPRPPTGQADYAPQRNLSDLVVGHGPELNAQQKRIIPRYTNPARPRAGYNPTDLPYDVGGSVTDWTGSPALGAAANVATSLIPFPPGGPVVKGAARGAERILRPGVAGTEMRGGGAAETSAETLRRQRASDLPVPIDLTKGQATRDFAQQQFEKETAKSPKLGEPLRERFSDQNKKMLLNFDAWVDQTGAAEPSLRGAGRSVVGAIEKKAAKAKNDINAAYEQARTAGEMALPVKTDAIVKYIERTRPEAINAPVLASIEQKLIQLGGATRGPNGQLVAGQIPLNELEEIRKMINMVSDTTPTNLKFGGDAKRVIDEATTGAGGTAYARARRLRERYAREFEDQGVIDKMVRTKPGTSDRAVAYEDIFNHAVLNGSLDDMRAVRRVLQTQGDEGKQAWKELQGQAVTHLKESAIKGVSTDQMGNSIISPAALNKAIQSLDRDGKLEYLFGKKGAQQIRDVADLAKDVYTAPPGSVNSSNTASVLLAALDSTVSATTGLPAPLATAFKLLKEQLAGRKVKKRVTQALTSPPGTIPPPP